MYNTEFIVTKVYVLRNYNGFSDVITRVEAHWKITNSQYPRGFSKYDLSNDIELNVDPQTFIPLDQVEHSLMEGWLTKDMSVQDKIDIKLLSLNEIIRKDQMADWVVVYDEED